MSVEHQQSSQNAVEPSRRRHWLGLPVIHPIEGSLAGVLHQLPHFGRQPFTMASVNGSEVAVNPYLDMVYRVPARQGESPVPVGVVSKNYRLVDHHQVLRTIEEVLADFGLDSAKIAVRAEWTAHGERARFSLVLPSDDRFSMMIGDGDEMRFRIEVFNSVSTHGFARKLHGEIDGPGRKHRDHIGPSEVGCLLIEPIKLCGKLFKGYA